MNSAVMSGCKMYSIQSNVWCRFNSWHFCTSDITCARI